MDSFRDYIESLLNRTGQELSGQFHLVKHRAWNQTQQNCYDIAKHLAEKHGYVMPTKMDIVKTVDQLRASWRGWDVAPTFKPSLAKLVVYDTDNLNDAHVAFEYKGKEFNFASLPNFKVVMKIPLEKAP